MDSAAKVLKTFLAVVLSACFVLQVRDGISKYLGRKTATASSERFLEEMHLPFVTLCSSGAWPTLDDYYRMSKHSRENLAKWWDSSRPKLQDIIEFAGFGDVHNFERISYDMGNHQTYTLKHLDTIAGRCFNLKVNIGLKRGQFLYLSLREGPFVNDTTVHLYHDEGSAIGLYNGQFPMDVLKLTTTPGGAGIRNVELVRKTVTRLHIGNGCDEDGSAETYLDGIREYIRRKILGQNVCWTPHLNFILNQEDVESLAACSNSSAAFKMFSHIMAVLTDIRQSGFTSMRIPCTFHEYTSRVVDNNPYREIGNGMGEASPRMVINYAFGNREVVDEEFLVYDVNGIVGGVGGSLGLFLGFSCFGCSTALIEKALQFMERKPINAQRKTCLLRKPTM